jgi:antitoxin MazE
MCELAEWNRRWSSGVSVAEGLKRRWSIKGMSMRSRVSRWGDSLAIRIPASVAREVRVEAGDSIELQVEDGHLVITPVRRTYTLDELVAGITDENRHDGTEWGSPVGAEAW